MAHVQIRGGVADWYWTADPGGLVEASDAHGRNFFFGEPRSKCGRRDAEDLKFRSADVAEAGSRRSMFM